MNKANLRNISLLLALVLVVGVAVTGCMSEGNRGLLLDSQNETSTPGRPSPAPNDTSLDGQGANGANGVNGDAANEPNGAGRFDWTGGAAQVEANIKRISEVSDARVVVSGDTALVGVKFDQAYRGELTERIREMVAAEVMEADPQITTVAVTADGEDVGTVYELSERSALGKDLDTLKEDIEEIVRNATTLR